MKLIKGDRLPDAKVFIFDNDPKEVSIKEIIGEDKVIIKHLPGFINATEEIKKKGIKKILCISVNDPFVMNAWGKIHNVGNKILMVGDCNATFTKNIGAEVNLLHRGLGIRSSRYSMLVEKGIITKIKEEETAGKCESTAAENFIKEI